MCLQVVTPGFVRVVKSEGMPKSKYPGQKGDLKIVFDVIVRSCLSCQHDEMTLHCDILKQRVRRCM